MSNSSYAYAEVLEVLENMEKIYIQKIPKKFINFLKENASKDYQKHITTEKPLKSQNLNEKTLSILALINLKYWVESEEHKKELLEKYKENEIKELEKLSKQFDTSSIFDNANDKEQAIDASDKSEEVNIKEENVEKVSSNLPIENKTIFRKIIDYIKSKIFE